MRCPFRMKGFDQPDTCDPECAWRMTYEPAPSGLGIPTISSCAVAILAQEANGSYGVRFEGEDNDEVGANDVVAAGEFDALDEYAQTLERENEELRKLCGANDALAAENDVSEASVDANDGNADTREKLEADACTFVARAWEAGRNFEHRDSNTRYKDVAWSSDELIDLLYRQAAITEAEQREWWGGVVAELQTQVNKLTEQRDRWRSNWTERNMAYSELADECQELEAKVDELTEDYKASSNGLEILTLKNAELQTQVNNLNSENAKLSSDELHLRQALASAEYDNATLREKLGRVLDMVQEMERVGTLVDQEGNVIG